MPNNWVSSLFEEGWVGVTLFITITGFVFTVLTHEKDIQYIAFLRNRVLRLFPLIFLVTLYAVTAAGASTTSLFMLFGLLGGGTVYGTWTLIVEFQFYIAYPFLKDRLVHDSYRQTIVGCGMFSLLLVILRLACFYSLGNAQQIGYWTIFGQGDAFLAGILAGLAFLRLKAHPPKYATKIYCVALGLGLFVTVCVTHWMNERGGYYNQPSYPSSSILWVFWPTMIAVCWASILAPYCLLTLRANGAIARSLAYIGAISYSTYMLHFITLGLCDRLYADWIGIRLFNSSVWNEAAILYLFHYPVTLAVSALSYELIEKAFLKQRVPYLSARGHTTIKAGSGELAIAA